MATSSKSTRSANEEEEEEDAVPHSARHTMTDGSDALGDFWGSIRFPQTCSSDLGGFFF